MVYGVFSIRRRFPLILTMFLLAGWGGVMLSAVHAEEPAPPTYEPKAKADPDPSGFDLLQAYSQKIEKLKTFQKDHGLLITDLQERPNRAADEILRLIGGLETVMQQEAEQIFQQAMKSADPKNRDELLKRLSERLTETKYAQLQDIRRRVEKELSRRTVGDTVYPTVEAARVEQQKLEDEQEKKRAEIEQKDLAEVEKLKQELLTDRISQAMKTFGEEDARKMFDDAMRLVLNQRRERLKELIRKYPQTQAAAEGSAMLAAIEDRTAMLAGLKLREALCARTFYNQKWRRLKELQYDYPNTQAAGEAERIFQDHLAKLPPVVITNHSGQEVETTVDKSYSPLQDVTFSPGETRTFSTAFPLLVRIKIGENHWMPYRTWVGGHYSIETGEDNVPALLLAP